MARTTRKKPAATRRRTAPPKRGRPTSCTTAITKAICRHIAIGVSFKVACEAEAVPERTGHEWMVKGEEGTEPYATFSAAVTRARSMGVIDLHKQARGGAKGAQQATWLLERRFRDDYGPVNRLEHTGPNGGKIESEATVTVDYSHLSDDELRRLAAGGASAES